MSHRADLLDEARRVITQDRNNRYGPPDQDFRRTAGALSALGFRAPGDTPLQGHHVAMIQAVLKVSRLVWAPLHRDSWLDLAGYAACGHEAAELGQVAPVPAGVVDEA